MVSDATSSPPGCRPKKTLGSSILDEPVKNNKHLAVPHPVLSVDKPWNHHDGFGLREKNDGMKTPAHLHLYTAEEIKSIRKRFGVNQVTFWKHFLITQSAGCRYEAGRDIPNTVQILLNIAFGAPATSATLVDDLRTAPTADKGRSKTTRQGTQKGASFRQLPFGLLP